MSSRRWCGVTRRSTRGCPEPVKFPWAEGYDLPVWVAAYGPMALSSAGRVGDGLVLQLAEPGICKWLADQAMEAGLQGGPRYVRL